MIVKKINAILFAVLLIGSSFGVSIEKHFCGDYLADVALFTGAGCECEEYGKNDDCCHEEDEVFQADLSQFNTSVQRFPDIAQNDLLVFNSLANPILGHAPRESCLKRADLPPPKAVPYYVMNCSFTFYG